MIYILLAAVGLVLGSFVNALVWRLRQQELIAEVGEESKKAKGRKRQEHELQAKELSILTGRSMCPACHHVLAAKDLVPVASWVLLRGHCRYCHAPISWQYPLVELLAAGLFIVSYIWWPVGFSAAGVFDFCLWLLFLTAFTALAVYDLRWFLLPDRIVFPLIALAIIKTLADVTVFGRGVNAAVQAALAVVCIAGLFYLLHMVSRGGWIGFGDVKLAVVLGLLAVSPSHALLLLFVAALLGTVAMLPSLLRGRARVTSQVPFGPFLLAATFIVVLFGGGLIEWYGSLLHVG